MVVLLLCPGVILDGAQIEVMLAKPVDKDLYPQSPKFNRMAAVPAMGFIPVDGYGTVVPAIYPGSYPIPPKSVLLLYMYEDMLVG